MPKYIETFMMTFGLTDGEVHYRKPSMSMSIHLFQKVQTKASFRIPSSIDLFVQEFVVQNF